MQGAAAKSQSVGPSTAAPIYPERRSTYDFFPKPREKVHAGFPTPLAARVLSDGALAAIVSSNRIQLYSLSTQKREYSVVFEDSKTSEPLPVLCFCEVTLAGSGIRCLLVAVNVKNQRSQLHLFEVRTSRQLVVVDVPEIVTSLLAIDIAAELNGIHKTGFRQPIVVGTFGAHLIVLDLDLAWDADIQDPLPETRSLLFYTSFQDYTEDHFRSSRSVGDLACVDLLASYVSEHERAFLYNSVLPSGAAGESSRIPSNRAFVSALSYVQQADLLLVGYNFGPFQVWSLSHPGKLPLYASPRDADFLDRSRTTGALPVTNLLYQQPHPSYPTKAFIWVGRGALSRTLSGGLGAQTGSDPAVASFFELTLKVDSDKRTVNAIARVDLRHSELLSIPVSNASSSVALTPAKGGNQQTAGRILSCQILRSPNFMQSRMNASSVASPAALVNNFAVFFWESLKLSTREGVEPTSTDVNCAVFDLTQALDSQNFGRWQIYKLGEAMSSASPFLDVSIDMLTLSQYAGLSFRDLDPELTGRRSRRAAALSFTTLCVSKDGLTRISFLSPQQNLLSQFASRGPAAFEKIDQYSSALTALGMIANPSAQQLSRSELREAVFDVALLHEMGTLLCAYPLEPAPSLTLGDDAESTSNSPFLLSDPAPLKNWAARRVASLRSFLETFACRLLRQQSSENQEHIEHSISMIRLVLQDLGAVFEALEQRLILQSADWKSVLPEQLPHNQLRESLDVIESTQRFCEAMIWISQFSLVKEYSSQMAELIKKTVEQSRRARKNQFEHNNFYVNPNTMQRSRLASTDGISAQPHLMIDLLLSATPLQYPPQSLERLLEIYQLSSGNVSVMEKHLIFLYWLHDVLAVTGGPVSIVHAFCSAFFIPSSLRKLIGAFWSLDNGLTTEAFTVLREPDVNTEWILHAIRALRDLGAPREALALYRAKRAVPRHLAEAQLVCEVLLSNGLLAEAFSLQRRLVKAVAQKAAHGAVPEEDLDAGNTTSTYRSTLFGTILSHCGVQSEELEILLQMPLDSSEFELLETFLRNHPEQQRATDILLVVLLQRNQYKRAVEVYDQTLPSQHQALDPDNARFRKALVDNALLLIPPRQRAAVAATRPVAPAAGVVRPQNFAATPAKAQLYPQLSAASDVTPRKTKDAAPVTPAANLPVSPRDMIKSVARSSPLKATPIRSIATSTPASSRIIALRSVVSPTIIRTPPTLPAALEEETVRAAKPVESSVPLYPALNLTAAVEAAAGPPVQESPAPPPSTSLMDVDLPEPRLAERLKVPQTPESRLPIPTVVRDLSVKDVPPSSPAKKLIDAMAAPPGSGALNIKVSAPVAAPVDVMAVDEEEPRNDDGIATAALPEDAMEMLAKVQAALSQTSQILTAGSPTKPVAKKVAAAEDSDSDDLMVVSETPSNKPRNAQVYSDAEESDEIEDDGEEDDEEEEDEGEESDEDDDDQGAEQPNERRPMVSEGVEVTSAPSFMANYPPADSDSEDDVDADGEEEEEDDEVEEDAGDDENLVSISQRGADDEQNLGSDEDEADAGDVEMDDEKIMQNYLNSSKSGAKKTDPETSDEEEEPKSHRSAASRRSDSRPAQTDAMEVDDGASDDASSIGAGALPSSVRKERLAISEEEHRSEAGDDDSDEEPSQASQASNRSSTRNVAGEKPTTSVPRNSVDLDEEENSRASRASRASRSSRASKQRADDLPSLNSSVASKNQEPEKAAAPFGKEADEKEAAQPKPSRASSRVASRASSRASSRMNSKADSSDDEDSMQVDEQPAEPVASSRPRRAATKLSSVDTSQSGSDMSQSSRPRRGVRLPPLTAAAKRPARAAAAKAAKPPLAPADVPKPAGRKGAKAVFVRTKKVPAAEEDEPEQAEAQAEEPANEPEKPAKRVGRGRKGSDAESTSSQEPRRELRKRGAGSGDESSASESVRRSTRNKK